MNTIEELIQKECPEGVEYLPMKEVCEIGTGSQDRKDAVECGKYPFYVRSQDVLRIDKYLYDEEAIIIPGEGGIGDIFHYINGKYGLHQRAYRIHPFIKSICTRFLFYYMCSKFKQFIFNKAVSATVTSIRKPMLELFPIPVPPLSVQNKIVEILDKFTSLEAELQAELEARKKQYEYYRNQLLDFTGREDVERFVFSEICEVINGRAYKQTELLSHGKYRVLRVGNFFSNSSWYYSNLELEDKYYCQSGDLLYAWSASFGPHIWEEEKVIYHYHIWKLVCKDIVDKRFLFYWLQSNDMERQVSSEKHGATMAHLTKAMIEKLIVPLPSLTEQQRIVTILDKFEALINDQTASLAAEMKARHQQYEYYRDKLLTFQRKEA